MCGADVKRNKLQVRTIHIRRGVIFATQKRAKYNIAKLMNKRNAQLFSLVQCVFFDFLDVFLKNHFVACLEKKER